MTSNAAPNEAPPATVSPQSAFWALVPIALCSMTQPSGRVFAFPLRSSWVLHSSPIVCAGDAIYTLVYFLWLSISFMSPHAAIRFIARRRLRDTIVNGTGSFSALQQNLVFRLTLFIFGALPQLLKLCGMQGIWGTKLAGGLFFGSFMVLEVIVFLSSEEDVHHSNTFRSQAEESFERNVGDGVLAVSLWLDHYLMAIAAHAIVIKSELRLWPYTIGLIVAGLTTVVKMWMPKQEKVSLVDALMLVPLIIGTTLSGGLWLPLYEVLKAAQSKTSVALTITAAVSLGLTLIGQGIFWHHKFKLQTKGKYIDVGISLELGILVPNVLAAALYYAFKYDPAGTVKPGWTDLLG